MKRLMLVAILLSSPLWVSPLSAQSDQPEEAPENLEAEIVPIIKDVEGLRIKLAEQVQNPETKVIIFDLVVYSEIRSDRVQLNWSVDGDAELIDNFNQVSFKTDPGDVRTIQIKVKPRARGWGSLRIRVEAFEAEGTYLATAFQRIYSLGDGTRLPVVDSYQTLQLVSGIKQFAILLLRVFGAILLVKVGYDMFRRWLYYKERQLEII